MMDLEGTLGELKRLSEAQVVISIDDFGTGYSSLQYLHQLPVSLLKIDQSFIRRLPGDRSASYILDAATTLAHNMGIKTIAEGVENPEIYSYVAESGCDMAQGFAISHPLPGKEFAAWFIKYGGKWRFSEDLAGSS
jgi:EAL domain-containing protein (putative c-di-GMP-specific phosphodiesterase class I)